MNSRIDNIGQNGNDGEHYEEDYTPEPCGNCDGTGLVKLRIGDDPPVDIGCRVCGGSGVKDA